MPFPINTVHRLALEDGTSLLLLEDNSSKLILDEAIALDDPLNAATVATLTPGLTFVGVNQAAANQTYEIEVDTVNTFDSISNTYDSQLTQAFGEPVAGGTASSGQVTQAQAQSFTPTSSFNLTSIDLKLIKFGTATGTVTVSIYSNSQTGTNLGTTLTPIAASSITGSFVVYNFTFTPIAVRAGTVYFIVVETSSAWDTTNTVSVGTNTGNHYTNGNISHRDNNAWIDIANEDFYFVVYGTVPLLDKTSDLNTGFVDDTTSVLGDDELLLEDNVSDLLLEDGVSFLKLNYSYPSGDYMTFTVPSGILSNSTTYYWRARQKVSNGGAYPATWSEIRSFTVSISAGGTALSSTLLMLGVG